MKIPDEVFIKAIREGKILPYEPELIEKLRTIHYKGFPLSILLLSKEICNGDCYTMSMNLSRAMERFTLIHGDVNCFDLNDEYPNHSWIEKDVFVYDTTFGLRWDKGLYYSLFKPKIREIYDENTVKYYQDYQKILRDADKKENPLSVQLVIQSLEVSEAKKPSVNQSMLQNEIDLWRQNNGIKDKFSDEHIQGFQKILTNLKTEQGS